MTKPRSTLVSLSDTPWYHVVNRCVRRAFLCGDDAHSGKNHDHRRNWIVDRVKQLSGVFAIDVAAYAVMSNHYHLVLRVDAERARQWGDAEVLRRWSQLFDGPLLVQRSIAGQEMGAAEQAKVAEWADAYRVRLVDLSWFMRVLNESIARQANAEDKVTGRFWEGRFKSQALLDEQAILTAMTYVDLNPIRAAMAETPEQSEHTSVAERMAELTKRRREPAHPSSARQEHARTDQQPLPPESAAAGQPAPLISLIPLRHERHLAQLATQPLMPFDATGRLRAAIPFAFEDYVELVEATGRCQHPHKRGKMDECTPKLLQRLGVDPEQFIVCSAELMKQFGSAVGAPAQLSDLCAARQVRYLRGMRAARRVFEPKAA
jgi:hypothetical protein